MTQKRRTWGTGSVRKRGGTWYVRFSHSGKQLEIRTDAKSKREAVEILTNEVANRNQGYTPANPNSVRVRELYDDMVADYRRNQRRSSISNRWAHLSPVFAGDRVRDVTTIRLQQYADLRLGDGAKPSTVRNELAALRRMLNLGRASGKVNVVPKFPAIVVNNARQGFARYADLVKLRAELRPPLRPFVTVAFWTGMRRGELLGLEWRHVDLDHGRIRIPASMSKNGEGRTVPLALEAHQSLLDWRRATDEVAKRLGRIIPQVFHRNGKPIKYFYGEWRSACERAGLDGLILHDFRRSAVRNLVRVGIDSTIARRITGHKTRSVFDRYDITDESDLDNAAEKLDGIRAR